MQSVPITSKVVKQLKKNNRSVRTVPKSNSKIVKRNKIDTHNTQICDGLVPGLVHTFKCSGYADFIISSLGEIMRSYMCFPRVNKMMTLTYISGRTELL